MKKLGAVWIYLCGLMGSVITAAFLSNILSVYPPTHIESFGPVVPVISRAWSGWLHQAPILLGACAAISSMIGIYLWRSKRPIEGRMFMAALISALNLFFAMFCAVGLLIAYFYLPKIANLT